MKIGIVVSDFNGEITSALLESAKQTLQKADVPLGEIIHVPGCFEIPFACKMLALQKNHPNALVALGVILQGGTDQNIYLAQACFSGLAQVQLDTGVPIGLGVISAPTINLAWERTKGELDRGREAALAAIQMAQLKKGLGPRVQGLDNKEKTNNPLPSTLYPLP